MNSALRKTAAAVAILLAISGMHHGVFEVLQGNTATPGFFIEGIGPDHVMWKHGQEGAVSVVPNFLATGILAIATSLVIVGWALFGLGRRGGATVLLGLFVLLFLFGGGVAQMAFFIPLWAFATRIDKPLKWWRRALPQGGPAWLGHIWRPGAIAFFVLMLLALWVSTTGIIPGVDDPDTALAITLSAVGASLILSILSYVSAIAADIRRAQ